MNGGRRSGHSLGVHSVSHPVLHYCLQTVLRFQCATMWAKEVYVLGSYFMEKRKEVRSGRPRRYKYFAFISSERHEGGVGGLCEGV